MVNQTDLEFSISQGDQIDHPTSALPPYGSIKEKYYAQIPFLKKVIVHKCAVLDTIAYRI